MKYIKYELLNTLGNFFSILFGVIMPTMMTLLFYFIFSKELPVEAMGKFSIQIYVTNLLMAPLAVIFIGFAALFSQEIEKEVTVRMSLFGYTEKKQMQMKFLAQAIVVTLSILIYTMIVAPILKLPLPSIFGFLVVAVSMCLLSFGLFIAAYGISLLMKKFGPTFGIVMTVYFAIMMLSGMMGVQYNQLPAPVQTIAKLLPTTHMVQDIPKLWTKSQYNLMPLIQSMLFLLAICVLLYLWGIHSKKRRLG